LLKQNKINNNGGSNGRQTAVATLLKGCW